MRGLWQTALVGLDASGSVNLPFIRAHMVLLQHTHGIAATRVALQLHGHDIAATHT